MTNAVIYGRYSSEKQTESSIDAQVRACKEYADSHDINVLAVYADEAISGKESKTANRRQYQRMLREAQAHKFDMILIHKYDRVARSLSEHVRLEQKLHDCNVELVAVAQDFGSTKEAKIMRTLMWSLSEYYLDNPSEEVKKGHRENALKGLHNGGYALFGYRVVDQHYEINEVEAAYVRKMFQAAAERKGFKALIDEMEAAGIRGRFGKPIKYTQIYEMLRNERYTGVYIYCSEREVLREDRRTKPNAIRLEGIIPAIIDKALFMEVQKIMSEKKQTGRKGNYLCSGLVYCECGAKMHVIAHGEKYRYYSCSRKCGAPSVRMESVDEAALDYLHDLLSDANQEKIATSMREYKNSEKDRLEGFRAAIQERIKAKRMQYDTLMQNLSTGALPAEIVADIGVQMQAIKDDIAVLENTQPPADYTVEQIKAWLQAIKAAPDEKAIHLLIERIDVKNKMDFNITSTLKSIAGNIGAGNRT